MNTHKKPFSVTKKKICLNYPRSAAMGFFSKGLKKVFETAVVNEPRMFKPLKVYCTRKKIPKIYTDMMGTPAKILNFIGSCVSSISYRLFIYCYTYHHLFNCLFWPTVRFVPRIGQSQT